MPIIPRCVPCISAELKSLALDLVKEDKKQAERIASIKTCTNDDIINLCSARQKRQPSRYQVFIGECMKSKPIKGKPFGAASHYMRECAQEWREQKGGKHEP